MIVVGQALSPAKAGTPFAARPSLPVTVLCDPQ
jgi:hypothetical protein